MQYKLCTTACSSVSEEQTTSIPGRLLHYRLRHRQSAASDCHQLFVPRHRHLMTGRRAFTVAGSTPIAWNSLPGSLRDPVRFDCTFGGISKLFYSRVNSVHSALEA